MGFGTEINWYIGQDLEDATIVNDQDEEEKVPSKIWDQPLNIKKGDFLHLAPFDNEVLFKIPIGIKNLIGLMEFIMEKLNSKIQTKYKKIALKRIGTFFDGVDELKLQLQKNELTWFDILGDDCAWAGNVSRSKDGIWNYKVD